jgi:uncharacterized protein YdiU (UPF0061 family)
MDFDIGNILYIIITLVALSLGLLGKKKKKPVDGTSETRESESQPGFLENLERTLSRLGQDDREIMDLREYEPDLPPEDSEDEEIVEIVPEPASASSWMDNYEQILKRMEDREADPDLMKMESTSKPIEVIELEKEEAVDYFKVVQNFDAGTAIVYSAIINRLDY